MEECSLGTVQFSSVVQSCLTLCGFTDCSISGFPVHLRHPELTQTHVHRVGDAIQSSHPLLSPSPAFSLSKPQGLFQWVSSWYREGIFHKRVLSSVFRKKWGDENGFLLSVIFLSSFQFSSVQLLNCVWLFATPWTAAGQASLSITNSQNLLELMSIESMIPSNHLILCRPLLLPPSNFPSIREKGCCFTWRHGDSWPSEEKNSIWGQRWGLIAQSFCVIKFY